MRTHVINAPSVQDDEAGLTEVARAIAQGALAIIPTETVYGLAASPAHPQAMQRLRQLKGAGRPRPFTVHLGRPSEARDYVDAPSPLLRRLIRKAWPGPLTIIAHTDPDRTRLASADPPVPLDEVFHERTVGLRCPDHSVTAFVLSRAAVPIVASSANRAGQPPPRDLSEALRDFDGAVEFAVDSGRTRYGVASTIIEVDGNSYVVRRAGRIDERTLKRMERSETLFVCTGNLCRSPMAEHLFRHGLARILGRSVEELEAQGYTTASAGVGALPGSPASPAAVDEMRRRGIDLSKHRSQPLTLELLLGAERIFAMTPEHRRAILELAPGVAGRVALLDDPNPIADPIGGGPEVYRACAEQIERAVQKRLEEIAHEDRDW